MSDRLSPSREQEIRKWATTPSIPEEDIVDAALRDLLAELDAERATLAAIRAWADQKLTLQPLIGFDAGYNRACRELLALLASAPAETKETQPRAVCILECDSPSYPPTLDEHRQCGCVMCLRDLKRLKETT